ncbi:MAG: hypothetical protein ACE5GC_06345 [Acidimicrobiia bacterium]
MRARGGAVLVAVFTTGIVVCTPGPAAAHSGGGAGLPLPVGLVVAGAGIVLIASYLTLTVSWTEPKLQGGPIHRAVRVRGLGGVAGALRFVGLAGLALVMLNGVIGDAGSSRAIGPPVVWIALWLVVPFLSVAAGNFWRFLSPWRSLARLLMREEPGQPQWTPRLGVWPATAVLGGFTWFELVSRDSTRPGMLAIAATVYTVYLLAASRWLGSEAGVGSCCVFENYTSLLGAMSPIAWSDTRRRSPGAQVVHRRAELTYRGWLRGLPAVPVQPGLTAFLLVLIGTVTYDGISGAEWWGSLFGRLEFEQGFRTVALTGVVLVVGGSYALAAWVAARLERNGDTVTAVARSFAHTLVPIAFAFAFAHYFSVVLNGGQALIHAASDPFGLEWDLLGTATWRTVFFLPPAVTSWVQIAVIVAGHVAALLLVHDRALHRFGAAGAPRSEYALLTLLVASCSVGLLVLVG